MALTSIFITAYETRAASFWKCLSAPVSIWNAQTLPKPRRNIQLILPAQELYNVACLLNKVYAYDIKYHSYYLCKEELKREREREREIEREHNLSEPTLLLFCRWNTHTQFQRDTTYGC